MLERQKDFYACDHSQYILEARNIYTIFVSNGPNGPRATTALRNVSLSVERGEFLCLIGPSGCGKSTMLNLFAGLTRPARGDILHDGFPIDCINTRVGYVTQDDNLLPWRDVIGNVELALECKGIAKPARRDRALDYIQRVGLRGFERHYPHELSGGMRKRVSIIRTLVDDTADVILMDEPFGPLDAQTRVVLQDELLRLWSGTGKTVIFVTHDIVEAIALGDRIAIFSSGPGAIKSVRQVDLPRPRDVFHIHETSGFAPIYDQIFEEMKSDLLRG